MHVWNVQLHTHAAHDGDVHAYTYHMMYERDEHKCMSLADKQWEPRHSLAGEASTEALYRTATVGRISVATILGLYCCTQAEMYAVYCI